MNARMRALRSSNEVKLERHSSLRTRMLNQISIWLSHEVCLGVYTNRMRCPWSLRKAARIFWDFNTPFWPLTPRSASMPQVWATHNTRPSDWCVFTLSSSNTQLVWGSLKTVCSTWATKSAFVLFGIRVEDKITRHDYARV